MHFIYLLLALTLLSSPKNNIVSLRGYSMDVKFPVDSTFYNIAKPYKIKIDNEMNEVLTFSKLDLRKGQPESLLGNWTADICLEIVQQIYKGDIDIAMFNNGGLRSSLSKGEITKGDIFQLMPFENELVVVDLNKNEFKLFVEYYIKTGGQPIGFSNQFSLNDSVFSILTTDYLVNGGDKMIFYKNKDYTSTGLKMRDAIIDYCNQTDTIESKLDNRNLILNYEF